MEIRETRVKPAGRRTIEIAHGGGARSTEGGLDNSLQGVTPDSRNLVTLGPRTNCCRNEGPLTPVVRAPDSIIPPNQRRVSGALGEGIVHFTFDLIERALRVFRRFLTPDWLTAIGTLGAVVLALILALFGEKIGRLVVRPKLSLRKVRVGRPDSERTRRVSVGTGADAGIAYFFRLAIRNRGNAAAHDVQVFLDNVERSVNGKREKVTAYTPMNLLWSYRGGATLPTLLPDMPPTYCDLAHVDEPMPQLESDEKGGARLVLDVEFPPNIGGHVLDAGTYYLNLILASSNCQPRYYELEVVFPGIWFDDESKMFDIGFKMRSV